VVTTADYGVIQSWIRYWEKDLLSKPKELVLGSEYLVNILPQIIEPLANWQANNAGQKLQKNSKNVSERKLVNLLERAIVEDPIVDLVALEYPGEVEDLRRLLGAGAYDVGHITLILRTIREAPSSQTLKEALVRELAKGESADYQVLGATAVVMARRSIGQFTDQKLREFLKSTLVREGTFVLIEEHLGEMKAEEGLEERVRVVAGELLAKSAASAKVSAALNGEVKELFDLFGDDGNWRRFAHRLLARMRRMWVAALAARESVATDGAYETSSLASEVSDDVEAMIDLGTELVRVYASSVFRRAIQVVRMETIDEPEPYVADAGRVLAAFLGDRGVFHDPEAPGQHEGAVYGSTHRALSAAMTAIQIQTSEALADAYLAQDEEFISSLALNVGRRLTQILAETAHAANGAAALAAGDLRDKPEVVCLDWSARRAVHAELGRLLAPLGPRLLNHMSEAAHPSSGCGLPLGEDFWDYFAKYFSEATKQPMYVPWDGMDARILGRLVERLFAHLEGSGSEYLAIFRVGDLSPQGLGWKMGSVAFYDPASFDYGEGRRLQEATPRNSPFTHAAVRVSARTRVEARRHARGLLENALSCLSFGLSVHTGLAGFKPKVVENVFVLNLSTGDDLFGAEPWPDVGHTVQYADFVDAPRRARAYDRLLALSAEGGTLNELQESFLKAARWYRQARWEDDPATRFALYWICLEHIFAGGQEGKQKGLYEDLPALQITWRNLGQALLPLSWSLREVWSKIEGDDAIVTLVDANTVLRDWRTNELILLDPRNIRLLIDLTPPEKSEAGKVFRDYLTELEGLASQSNDISEYVSRLQDRQWFKLYLLYALRNKMFHEAVYDEDRLPYLANEIADVADGVLPKVVEEATSSSPECTTIEQLIERFGRQPWETISVTSDDY
jgi:hypothetical protein